MVSQPHILMTERIKLANYRGMAKTLGNVLATVQDQLLQTLVAFMFAAANFQSPHWKFFWSLSLTYIQRNVIYRYILGCIPHRRLLHRILPTVFESPLCPVCLSVEDSPSHLLFNCPSKERIWQGVIFEFLWPTTTIQDIQEALRSLDFSNVWYCQRKGIKPYRILIITLSQLWLAHMRYIYDNVPIDHTAILASIRNNVRQTIDEDQCHSLL
ncbi:hypothetical protein HMPREF1544_00750 [Mucor circinelloides 1006PhL]|uniref:Reverse transcriptase zinc-binding domain-containing protein n=1 Tax=Mucor circinelloides f. circinelloides (strain 1006PhL) TaxID=1220926 RepID=S2JVK8_MUCC1|nr:hypothetical protein HMPREF1544_00750 [Mucor circinelloides 1006PhL]